MLSHYKIVLGSSIKEKFLDQRTATRKSKKLQVNLKLESIESDVLALCENYKFLLHGDE